MEHLLCNSIHSNICQALLWSRNVPDAMLGNVSTVGGPRGRPLSAPGGCVGGPDRTASLRGGRWRHRYPTVSAHGSAGSVLPVRHRSGRGLAQGHPPPPQEKGCRAPVLLAIEAGDTLQHTPTPATVREGACSPRPPSCFLFIRHPPPSPALGISPQEQVRGMWEPRFQQALSSRMCLIPPTWNLLLP